MPLVAELEFGVGRFKKANERKKHMKKILLALMVLGLAAASASAGVAITWSTIYGAFDHSAANVTNAPADLLVANYNVTWQLIYAGANNVADDIDLGNVANGWVSGDDDVWATRTIALGGGTAPQDSTDWDTWMTWQGAGTQVYTDLAWNTAGFVYQRVYEGAPAELSWYFETGLQALNTGFTGSPQFPAEFMLDTSEAGFQPDQQIPAAPVPEPMTMSLMGLGALALAIRRHRS